VTHIPLLDLRTAHRRLRHELDGAIRAVLDDGRFVGGPAVDVFEDAWAAYCGARHGIGVANGTDALEIALIALGIGPGDEVIVPALTYAATAEAVANVGARVVFADIRPDTYTLDPHAVSAALSARSAAIVAVHLYGQPADMDGLRAIADARGLALVEDAAQAHGATWNGCRAGTLGHVACFSFYPSKNLGAIGDAGAIVTEDPVIAAQARAIRDHGQFERDWHELKGRNSRLDAIQAAVLTVKLSHLETWNAARVALAARYNALLGPVSGVSTPAVAPPAGHVYHLYTVRVAAHAGSGRRDALAAQLAAHGIGSRVYYPTPVHLQPAFADQDRGANCPEAEAAAREVLALPMHPYLTADDLDTVAACVAEQVAAEVMA
jgi:dTDP-4-amino-4,6-dideoxygalactose transaminase